jgi:endo-1,4-beta-xylanase
MKTFSMLLAACATFVGTAALPAADLAVPAGTSTLAVRVGTTSQTGTNNGFYHSFWTSGSMYVTYSNGAGGACTVDWQGNGDFTAGKGWNPGSARCVSPAPHT